MTIRNMLMATAAAALMTVGTASAAERISIGTGGTGGLFYVIGAGMAETLNKHMEGATARAEVTGASVENIHRVAAGQMTFGLSSSSTLYEAKMGEGPFEGKPLPVEGMAYLYPAVLQIATIEGTGIKDFAGLAGKRVSMGPPGSNAAVLAQRLLEAYGVASDITPRFLSYNEGIDALKNGQVDAAVVLAGAPTASLIDLDSQEQMHLLRADAETVKGMLKKYPYYQMYEIPAGTYTGQTEAITAINDPATLFTAKAATDDLIYRITSTLFGHLDELAEVHPQAASITLEAAPDAPIALHPGAKRYFDEAAR